MKYCKICGSINIKRGKNKELAYCPICEDIVSITEDFAGAGKKLRDMKIFISYGHDNHADFVKALAKEIEKQTNGRIKAWIDYKDIPKGAHWRREITEGINECHSVVAFLSSYSQKERGVCLDEMAIAISSKHGMLLTITLEPKKDCCIPPMVNEYQRADWSDYREVMERSADEYKQYIADKAECIISILDSDEIIKYDDEVLYLRKKLGLPEITPLDKFDRLISKKMVGREWLKERIDKWVNDKDAKRIIMIYGKPGSGKSMFVSNYQYYNQRVAAAFACDYQSNEFSNTDNIISWLAYKLAMRLPDYREWLMELFRDEKFDVGAGKDKFNKLIAQPLGKCNLGGTRDTMVIVIDALDETQSDNLARFVSEYIDDLKWWLRFVITARKEPEIVERFAEYPEIDLDRETDDRRADLLKYYIETLQDVLKNYTIEEQDGFLNRLVEMSEGVFTYAEKVCENILEDFALVENKHIDLENYKLPKGINGLFEETLRRKLQPRNAEMSDLEIQEKWIQKCQKPLGMIISSPEPLPVETLITLMEWDENEYLNFRRYMSTLLVESGDCIMEFHRSFGEWLDTTETIFASRKSAGKRNLAKGCYRIYENKMENMDDYMLLNMTKLLREEKGLEKEYEQVFQNKNYLLQIRNKENECYSKNKFSYGLKLCEEFIELFKGKNLNELDIYHVILYCRGLVAIGKEYETINRFKVALKWLNDSLEIINELTKEKPQELCYKIDLARVLVYIAYVQMECNEINQALENCKKSLSIRKKLSEKNLGNQWEQRELSKALNEVAVIQLGCNDISGALENLQKSLKIMQNLSEENLENQDYKNEAVITMNVAVSQLICNDINEASGNFKKSLESIIELIEMDSANKDYKSLLSVALINMAETQKKCNDMSGAFENCKKGLEIIRKLSKENPQNLIYKMELFIALKEMAGIQKSCNDIRGALKNGQKSLDIIRKLSVKNPENLQYKKLLAMELINVSYMQKECNYIMEALKNSQKSLDIIRKLSEENPENLQYKSDLYIVLRTVAEIQEESNDLESALENYQKSLSISEELNMEYPQNSQYKWDVARTLSILAEIQVESNDLGRALENCQRSLSISEKLSREYPENPQYKWELARTLSTLATIHGAGNDIFGAYENYGKSLNIMRILEKEHPENLEYKRDVDILSKLFEFFSDKTKDFMDEIDKLLEDIDIDKLLEDIDTETEDKI